MKTKELNKGIIVDIGTGDGKFVYEMAKRYPGRLFIGIDPNHKGLIKMSTRIYRKPARGGLENALFVLASIEDLPEELEGIANQIFINFPWGSLLKNTVLVEENMWKNLLSIAKEGAFIDIVLGYDATHDKSEIERLDLPELTLEYIEHTMTPKLEQLGMEILAIEKLKSSDLSDYPSSWAKKLRFTERRKYYHLRLQKKPL